LQVLAGNCVDRLTAIREIVGYLAFLIICW